MCAVASLHAESPTQGGKQRETLVDSYAVLSVVFITHFWDPRERALLWLYGSGASTNHPLPPQWQAPEHTAVKELKANTASFLLLLNSWERWNVSRTLIPIGRQGKRYKLFFLAYHFRESLPPQWMSLISFRWVGGWAISSCSDCAAEESACLRMKRNIAVLRQNSAQRTNQIAPVDK